MALNSQNVRQFVKESRGKIWIRTAMLVIFGTMFSFSLYKDLQDGVFSWQLGVIALIPCMAIGFWMSRLVPMHLHHDRKVITFSMDKIYFVLIWVLVIAKLLTGRLLGLPVWSDVLMVVILGLMSGRLSGICLRVRELKVANQFI